VFVTAWRRLFSAPSGISSLAREILFSGGHVMRNKILVLTAFLFSAGLCLAACPSADLTGDCFVDYEDFAVMAAQWLTTDPCIPDDMAYIPDGWFQMGDWFSEGSSSELPIHPVLVDSFFMSRYETTNRQYCDYLNSAYDANDIKIEGGIVYASSDDSNSYPYCDTHNADTDSQIDFSGDVFTVRTKSGRDMSNDPMVEMGWYGAAAYCNWRSSEEGKESCYNLSTWDCDFGKHGYRLATEAEWEYAARGGLSGKRFPWADPNITHSLANYYSDWSGHPSYSYDVSPTEGYHPLWNDGIYPYTSPVGFFDGTMKYKADYNWLGSATSYQTTSGANSYGLYDMAGNVREWCNDWWSSSYYSSSPTNNPTGPITGTFRVLRGGSWGDDADGCRVALHGGDYAFPGHRDRGRYGFRIVLDLE
jgi:sulfatase modifying factor 1